MAKINNILILTLRLDWDDFEDISAHATITSMRKRRDELCVKHNIPQNGYSVDAYFNTYLIEVNYD